MSLATRMLTPIALVMSIALTIVAWSSYEDAKRVVSANVVSTETAVVEGVSREINLMLESARNYMRVFAQNQAIETYVRWLGTWAEDAPRDARRNAPEQISFRDELKQSVSIYNYINFLAFQNKNGVVEASSDERDEGARRGNRQYFRDAMHGHSALEGPLYSSGQGFYLFMLSEPVFVEGRIAGVLSGAINMDYIAERIIDPVTLLGEGYIYVIDPNGQIILHPDRKKMIGSHMIEQNIFEHVTSGGSGTFRYVDGGHAYYSTYETLPNGWVVVATASQNVFLNALDGMRKHTLLVGFLALSCVLLAMFLIVNRMVAALREGVHFAKSVAEGDLDHTFDIRRDDELGTLATALNVMVGKLRESFALAERRTREAEDARAEATSTSRELEAVIDSVDGGVARFALDDDLHVLWANAGFYALSGRTKEEHEQDAGNTGIRNIYPEDRERLLQTIRDSVRTGTALSVEYRINRKGGGITWAYLRATRVGEWSGFPLFQGVFVDITHHKEILSALEMEQERYRIITEITEDITFELDFQTKTMTYSSNYEQVFGHPRIVRNYQGREAFMNSIHPDDWDIFDAIQPQFTQQQGHAEFEARVRMPDGAYQWFSICFKILQDRDGRPLKHIGRMSNINAKKQEENRLRREAQTDMLTGLRNKITFEQEAAQALEDGGHAGLIAVDVDDFKGVNDTYGHLFGDEVLRAVSSTLRETFRASDIIGRIGGDEFAVFACAADDEEAIRNRCAELLARLAAIDFPNGYRISASLGVSFAPCHGKDYPTLFSNADAALYHLKKHGGKGGYAVYGENEE